MELEDAPSLKHTVWVSRDRCWAFKILYAQLKICLKKSLRISLVFLTVFHSGKAQLEQAFLDNCVSSGSLNMTGTRERGTQTRYPKLSMSE